MKVEDQERDDHMEILSNITSIQGKQKYIEMQIENIIRYYSPKYDSSLQEYLKLRRKLIQNERILRAKAPNSPTKRISFIKSGLQNIMLKSLELE